jgi:hypothetical protein
VDLGQIRILNRVFDDVVKRRRGSMVRRGGALSHDFEVSFEHCGVEVVAGVESGRLRDNALFGFVRHAQARGRKARAGGADGAAACSDGAPRPGFSMLFKPPDLLERLRLWLGGRTIWTDPRRPGWFHAEAEHPAVVAGHLPESIGVPLAAMAAGAERLLMLSVGMTAQVFVARRVPVLFDTAGVDEFLTNALKLLGAARALPASLAGTILAPGAPKTAVIAGVHFLAVLLESAREGRCGVCGEETRTRKVVCSRCATPHHSECWSYSGGCSVYACGETEARGAI